MALFPVLAFAVKKKLELYLELSLWPLLQPPYVPPVACGGFYRLTLDSATDYEETRATHHCTLSASTLADP